MSTSESSDGSSESESVSSASEVSSIPSLTAASSSSSAATDSGLEESESAWETTEASSAEEDTDDASDRAETDAPSRSSDEVADVEESQEAPAPQQASGPELPSERARRITNVAHALVCFRFAERTANESPYRQNDVRWALAFHGALQSKLAEPGPNRSWVGEDWLKLAEPCLQRRRNIPPPEDDTIAIVAVVDLARLALVAVAARQITLGRAGEEEPKPECLLRWPLIAEALVIDASTDTTAALDNMDLRVRSYVLGSQYYRNVPSAEVLAAAANFCGEPLALAPFANPFANHRGNDIAWRMIGAWAVHLLCAVLDLGATALFGLACLAAFYSSQGTYLTAWSNREQSEWAKQVSGRVWKAGIIVLWRSASLWLFGDKTNIAVSIWNLGFLVTGGYLLQAMLRVTFQVNETGGTSRPRPRRGGTHEYLLMFDAFSNLFMTGGSTATRTREHHGIYAYRSHAVAWVAAFYGGGNTVDFLPFWLQAVALIIMGTRLGGALIGFVFASAASVYALIADELDTAAVLFGLDSGCRLCARLVGGTRLAAILYAVGTWSLGNLYFNCLKTFPGLCFCFLKMLSNTALANVLDPPFDDDPGALRRSSWWRRRLGNGVRWHAARGFGRLGLLVWLFVSACLIVDLIYSSIRYVVVAVASAIYSAMRPGFIPFVLGSACGGAGVIVWGWARVLNAQRKAQRDVRGADDARKAAEDSATSARKARESADARAAAAIGNATSAEARLRAAELQRDDAVARAAAEVARGDSFFMDGAERWAARLAEADARRAVERDRLCADVAAALAERDAARAALIGRAELEPRLRLALERRELGTVADKFVVEGVLDAAAARRLTNEDLQRLLVAGGGYWSQRLTDRIRAAVDEAFSADLILDAGGDPPKDLLCPLTLEIFEDPVVAVDGHTYERAAIEKWFQSKTTSPLTNARITTDLVPAHCVRSLADRYRVATSSDIAPAPAAPDVTTPLLASSRAGAAAPAPAVAATPASVDQEEEEEASDSSSSSSESRDESSNGDSDSSDSGGSSSAAAAPLASPRSRRAAQAARAAELRALAAATHSEVNVPVREAGAAPATPAPRPPAQLVMGGPLPRQPARVASNPELVVGTDPEMEHPPAVTPDAAN